MEANIEMLTDPIHCERMVTSASSFYGRVSVYFPEAMQCQLQVQVGRVGEDDRRRVGLACCSCFIDVSIQN